MQADLDLVPAGVQASSKDSPLVPAYLEYEVQKILAAKKSYSNDYFYLVKWKNWSINESTWEPEEHLKSSRELVLDFLKKKSNGGTEFNLEQYPQLNKFWTNKGEQNPKRGRPRNPLGRFQKKNEENGSNDDSTEKGMAPKQKRIRKAGKNRQKTNKNYEQKDSHCESELSVQITNNNLTSKMSKSRVFKQKQVPLFLNANSLKQVPDQQEQQISQMGKGNNEIEVTSQQNQSQKLQSMQTFPTNQENMVRQIITEKQETQKKTKSQQSGKENEKQNEEHSKYEVIGLRKTADKSSFEYFIRHKATKQGKWITHKELIQKGPLALAISLIKYYESKLIFKSELPQVQ